MRLLIPKNYHISIQIPISPYLFFTSLLASANCNIDVYSLLSKIVNSTTNTQVHYSPFNSSFALLASGSTVISLLRITLTIPAQFTVFVANATNGSAQYFGVQFSPMNASRAVALKQNGVLLVSVNFSEPSLVVSTNVVALSASITSGNLAFAPLGQVFVATTGTLSTLYVFSVDETN